MLRLEKDIRKTRLILTGIDLYPLSNTRDVFLGDWVKTLLDKGIYSDTESVLIVNPWDDRKKLFEDHCYLKKLHGKVSKKLSATLNKYHNTNYSNRFWEILFGMWLVSYLAVIFDRYSRLQHAMRSLESFAIQIPSKKNSILPPHDAFDEYHEQIQSDEWNQLLCIDLVKFLGTKKIQFEKSDNLSKNIKKMESLRKSSKQNYSFKEKTKGIIKLIIKNFSNIYSFLRMRFGFLPGIYLDATGFTRKSKFILKLLLLQDPFFTMNFTCHLKNENMKEISSRKSFIGIGLGSSKFEKYLGQRILNDIPMEFLEHFSYLQSKAKSFYFPKIIVSDGSYWTNPLSKVWMALAQERGTKLIFCQHGGCFTQGSLATMNVEEKVSDLMITWTKPIFKKHCQLPPQKYIDAKKITYSINNKDLLILGIDMPRYVFRCQVNPGSGQIFLHYDQTIKLFFSLNEAVRSKFKIRPYHIDQGWEMRRMYEKDLGVGHLSIGSYNKVISEAKVIVCTYPETTFSDCIAKNVPTILLYPENLWELHVKMRPLLETLKKAKIVFHEPEKAAQHINEIWSNPLDWWGSKKVVSALQDFKIQAQNNEGNSLRKWSDFLKKYKIENF